MRHKEGNHLPSYEFALLGKDARRMVVGVVAFPQRMNPYERIHGGDVISVDRRRAIFHFADGAVPAVSMVLKSRTAVTIYGDHMTRGDVIAAAQRLQVVSEVEWRERTRAKARSFPDRTGFPDAPRRYDQLRHRVESQARRGVDDAAT